jgi:hypothetical protein
MGSEAFVLDRIASPTMKPKALNSASVALRAGTQGEFEEAMSDYRAGRNIIPE